VNEKKPASNATLINPFQELVSLILTSLKAKGEHVLSAERIPNEDIPGKTRDVDILLITFEGGKRVRVAFEAKDETRPTTIERVEQYLGKYFSRKARVPVERLVIVSRNGFTKDAITKAALNDVKLLTLDEAKRYDWAEVGWKQAQDFSKIKSLKVKFPPHIDRIDIKPPLPAEVKDAVLKHGQLHGPECSTNCLHGTLFTWAQRNVLQSSRPEIVAGIEDMKARALTDPDGARIVLNVEAPFESCTGFVRDAENSYPIESIEVELHTVNGTASATCKSYSMSGDGSEQNFHHLKAELGSFSFQFVLKHGDGPSNLALKAKNHFGDKAAPKPKGNSAKPRKNPRERAQDRKAAKKRSTRRSG